MQTVICRTMCKFGIPTSSVGLYRKREKHVIQKKLDDLEESHKVVLLTSHNPADSKWSLPMYQRFSQICSDVEAFVTEERLEGGRRNRRLQF